MVELDAREARAYALHLPARWMAPAFVAVAAAVWTLGVRGIDHRFISFSDGVYTYIASEVAATGAHQLYGTIVLSQPPGPVLGAAALWKLWPHVETIRVGLAALDVLTAILTYRLARSFGIGPRPAVVAALLALTAPIRGQFTGLDGEAFLTPLALALALALERRRSGLAGALAGAGLFFKLTWLPFLAATGLIVARRDGLRGLGRAFPAALAVPAALYGAAILRFNWRPGDIVSEVVLAQSHSGQQLALLPGILAILLVLWWPLLTLSYGGLAAIGGPTRALVLFGAFAAVANVKAGNFFSALDPVEPLLGIAAVAGALALWRRKGLAARSLVVVSACCLLLHAASLSNSRVASALPPPVGAAVIDTQDEAIVDRAVRVVDANSRADEEVLVNPFFAVLAGRHEVDDQADWFILHALGGCDRSARAGRCALWQRMKSRARTGTVAVVGVDANVTSFDSSFRRDTGVASMRKAFHASRAPIDTTLYVMRPRG